MEKMLSFIDLARQNAAAALPPQLLLPLKGLKQTDVSEKCFVSH
jgi:hypothetical protein